VRVVRYIRKLFFVTCILIVMLLVAPVQQVAKGPVVNTPVSAGAIRFAGFVVDVDGGIIHKILLSYLDQ
jgi:hypothetical protein